MTDWKELGLRVPRILLPKSDVELPRWAVLACDQYSSQPEYWDQVGCDVGETPSILHQIIPECYLEDEDLPERVQRACACMGELLAQNRLEEWPEGAVLVKRSWGADNSGLPLRQEMPPRQEMSPRQGTPPRQGLVMALDLEAYDYAAGSRPLIRPSEGTILERIPPRLKLRSAAEIEYPHILILIDDPERSVIEPLFADEALYEPVYDFDLGWQGGHITGRYVPWAALGRAREALAKLKQRSEERYGEAFLMAVGDGNHSLATAKAHWENIKESLTAAEREDHPARFALAELVNVYDESLEFEPITRILMNVPEGGAARIAEKEAAYRESYQLPLAALQAALDDYLKEEPDVRIDYIHGEDAARAIVGDAPDSLVYPSDVIEKDRLFSHIAQDGVLPRKAFSMGLPDQKRFYLEGRRIR